MLDGNSTLSCPRCGGDYLHHETITTYDRPEDAPQTIETSILCGVATIRVVPSSKSRNPSVRRDGVAVGFRCEGCSATPELTIKHDRGNTLLSWRDILPRSE